MDILLKTEDGSKQILLSDPSEYKLSKFDLTKSQRTTDGSMIMQYIATKRRLDLSWNAMEGSKLNEMLDFFAYIKQHTPARPYFYVYYPDAEGTLKQFLAYHGDISYSLEFWNPNDAKLYWKVSVAFIEV